MSPQTGRGSTRIWTAAFDPDGKTGRYSKVPARSLAWLLRGYTASGLTAATNACGLTSVRAISVSLASAACS